jgi:hypothetical protein
MEEVRGELKCAVEAIQTIVEDLNLIITDFNDVIGDVDYNMYVALVKTLRKELADIQLKSWALRMKEKVKEEKEEKAIEEMLVNKMKEYMAQNDLANTVTETPKSE